MKKWYEATYILDIQGKEEGVKEALDEITKQIETLGGKVKGTQKMDRRKFERNSRGLDAGYYLGVTFQLEADQLEALRQKLVLNSKVYRQFYMVTTAAPKKAKAEPAAA
jgi:small subunit ribosomal protein S6